MSKPNGGGGFKNILATGVTLLVIASVLVGIAKANNINSPGDLYTYFKSWSDKVWSCNDNGKLEWNCDLEGHKDNSKKSNGSDNTTTAIDSKDTQKESLAKLNKIKITDSTDVEYNRGDWKHWVGSPCNTRETVLKEQGKNVKTDKECRATAGSWIDPYSGDEITNASKLDIDHIIPLSYAAQHGGQSWDAAKKQKFANDTSQLLAVSAGENRKKSDKGPSDYMPPNKNFQCEYSKLWVDTANKYGVSITEKDKTKLTAALKKCGE